MQEGDGIKKNVLIVGGGTGGHLYPAIAIIEYLQEKYPGLALSFIGSEKGMGYKLIPEMGVDFYKVKARGLTVNKSLLKKLSGYAGFLFAMIPGFFKALKILRRKKINRVLGMGGYVCAPVFLAAMVRNIDFSIHEQNYIPGRLNKFFSPKAKYVFTSFKETEKYLKTKDGVIVFSGNPVRRAVRDYKKSRSSYGKWGLDKNRFTIVAFGGSQGAQKINNTINGLYEEFKGDSRIQILLISGSRYYADISKKLDSKINRNDNLIFKVEAYIDQMDQIYHIADLIIARAGANTVFETAATGIPSILIPYPHAAEDHQFYNAKYIADMGKAVLIRENKLSAKILSDIIKDLLKNGMERYLKMKRVLIPNSGEEGIKIITVKLMEDYIGTGE
jgi:UDP-N-acetylglucosamine--N-acetylmuramyl-(pentapeptide) pyrophosphoryl-undecaprenol N-acetylglucosamine transferase